jgi:hAT family C-terminal dimerisation region
MKLLQKANPTVAAGGQGDVNFKIEHEVNTYVYLEISDNEENPLHFWKKQEDNYPTLSVLAKCYLSI